MDIRVFLNANNLTETGFADEPIFWRKSAQLTVYCRFLFKEIGNCTILSENHKEESKSFSCILEYSLMQIIVQKQMFLTSLYFGENLPNWPSIVHFYLRKLYICTILSRNHQEGEQIIFMDIRILLYTNNRTETDFSDESLFWRKSAQLTVYCRYLFKEIGFAPFYHEITKRESKSFSPRIVQKQMFLTSLYFRENRPNWPSIVHFYLRKLYICTLLSRNHQEGEQIIFMDIRIVLYANNRPKTDFSDEPLFWRKSAQLTVYCRYLFKEIGFAPFYRKIIKRERANHFHGY